MKTSRSDMERLEIEACLESMQILVDTREQPSERASRRYEAFGRPYRRQTLSFGDYTYNFRLPSGDWLHGPNTAAQGHCIVERKMNLEELSGCFTRERNRFRREFEKAKDAKATVYLLIEDGSWEKIVNHGYKTKYNPRAFLATLVAWMIRYDFKVIFCKKETSGRLISEILYRNLKERLEDGFYG